MSYFIPRLLRKERVFSVPKEVFSHLNSPKIIVFVENFDEKGVNFIEGLEEKVFKEKYDIEESLNLGHNTIFGEDYCFSVYKIKEYRNDLSFIITNSNFQHLNLNSQSRMMALVLGENSFRIYKKPTYQRKYCKQK